jgi:predicted transcriptional regulator
MDKRYKPLPLAQQVAQRRIAIEEALANPQWSLAEVVRHIRTSLRLTVPELARVAKVSPKTILNLEAGRTPGTVQTFNQILAAVGLQLGVQRIPKAQPMEAPGQSG